MALLIFIMPAMPIQVQGAGVCDFYVATTGLDTNPGIAETSPWKTIQKAANTASAGKTVCVLSGTYNEVVAINKSGDANNGFITFMSYPSDGVAILDVSGRTPPSGKAPVIKIQNKSFIRIKGFEIRNYKTSAKGSVPIGILMIGSGRYIELRNNNIHDIQTTSRYGNAHGIAVYGTGTTSATAITNLVIEGNQVHHDCVAIFAKPEMGSNPISGAKIWRHSLPAAARARPASATASPVSPRHASPWLPH